MLHFPRRMLCNADPHCDLQHNSIFNGLSSLGVCVVCVLEIYGVEEVVGVENLKGNCFLRA